MVIKRKNIMLKIGIIILNEKNLESVGGLYINK